MHAVRWRETEWLILLWREIETVLQKAYLFCVPKWGRGWRVATVTLGFGQTSTYFYRLLRHLVAGLHALVQNGPTDFRKFGTENAACLRTRYIRCCCHDRQRYPLDRGFAGWRRSRLNGTWTHMRSGWCRMLLSVELNPVNIIHANTQ